MMSVTLRRILIGLALIFFVVFMLIGFGPLDSLDDDRAGWLGLGLVFLAAGLMP